MNNTNIIDKYSRASLIYEVEDYIEKLKDIRDKAVADVEKKIEEKLKQGEEFIQLLTPLISEINKFYRDCEINNLIREAYKGTSEGWFEWRSRLRREKRIIKALMDNDITFKTVSECTLTEEDLQNSIEYELQRGIIQQYCNNNNIKIDINSLRYICCIAPHEVQTEIDKFKTLVKQLQLIHGDSVSVDFSPLINEIFSEPCFDERKCFTNKNWNKLVNTCKQKVEAILKTYGKW